MATTWKIGSKPPHDFYICLDINEYFDYEHSPEEMFENGFTRPVPVGNRDILVTIHFNGDVTNPEFTVETNDQVSETEKALADRSLARILGTDLDMAPLYKQAANDKVLQPLLHEFYGLKRVSRANLFEDAVNRIIQTQIQHRPTARKMVYNVREAYGHLIVGANGKSIPAWPRPGDLIGADPQKMKQYGLSLRKGEYITGFAHEILSGAINLDELERCEPGTFYSIMTGIRGIGPTTAQNLMLSRNKTEASFPVHKQGGKEKGIRRWIIYSYGGDPDHTSDREFLDMIAKWKGCEASALEFLFVNYIIREKKKSYQKK